MSAEDVIKALTPKEPTNIIYVPECMWEEIQDWQKVFEEEIRRCFRKSKDEPSKKKKSQS